MRPDLGQIRAVLGAGFLVLLPLFVALVVFGFVFKLMRGFTIWFWEAMLFSPLGRPLLEAVGVEGASLDGQSGVIRFLVSAAAVATTIALVYALGELDSHPRGRRGIDYVERKVTQVPFFGAIHTATKQVLLAFVGEGGRAFQQVVLVPYPTPDFRSIAFVTGTVFDRTTGEEYVSVFLASTPNPTTGFVFLTRRSEVVVLDWTFEQGMKAIMSGGVLLPSELPTIDPPRPHLEPVDGVAAVGG